MLIGQFVDRPADDNGMPFRYSDIQVIAGARTETPELCFYAFWGSCCPREQPSQVNMSQPFSMEQSRSQCGKVKRGRRMQQLLYTLLEHSNRLC